MPVVDYRDDVNGQLLHRICLISQPPDYVLNPSSDGAGVPTGALADPVRGKFPMHTKAAAWLGHAFFRLSEADYGKKQAASVQEKVTKFVRLWGIEKDVQDFDLAMSSHVKKASAIGPAPLTNDDYAVVHRTATGGIVRKYRLDTPANVKKSAEAFYAERRTLPYDLRRKAAARILSVASHFDDRARQGEVFEVSEIAPPVVQYLYKAAGLGFAVPDALAETMAKHAFRYGCVENTDKVGCLAVETEKSKTVIDGDALCKLAAAVDEVDLADGLRTRWADVPLPEEWMVTTVKQANDAVNKSVTLVSGTVWPLALLANLPLEKIAAVIGEDFADACKTAAGFVDIGKFADQARALPRPDAEMLDHAIRESMTEKQADDLHARVMELERKLDAAMNTGKERTSQHGLLGHDGGMDSESWAEHFRKAGAKIGEGVSWNLSVQPDMKMLFPNGNSDA